MPQRNSSYLLGLLVYFIGVSQLPIVIPSPVNVSATASTTIPGNETVYPSSTITSFATANTSLLVSISASNATTQFVTAYSTAAPTVSQGNNSSTTGIFPTTGYVSTSAANTTTQLVTIYPTGSPTTSQGNEPVDISSTVASSSTDNTNPYSSTSAFNTSTQFVTAYITATPTTSLQSETLISSSTTANSSEGISTSAPNTTLLTTTDRATTSANETATIIYAGTTSSGSETPSKTSMSINESTSEKTTTLEASSTTGTTSTKGTTSNTEITSTTGTTSSTGTNSTTGTTSTTQCTKTTTKQPIKECVIYDADLFDQLRTELINDEGYRVEIYEDTTGNPTFGIGHKITPDDPEYGKPLGTKISKERIEEAFKTDVKAAIASCCKLFDDFQNLPKEVQLIILNMRFNLGHSGLEGFKKFREAVNNGDWDKAADEMVDSKWYKQVPNRAKRLEERMRKVGKKC